jgi:hypothetical protein
MFCLRTAVAACAALAISGGVCAEDQDKDKVAPQASGTFRGVYATIDIRKSQAMELRLASGTERRAAVREVLRSPGSYAPPVLYALANALSGDRPEDAIFWYHIGRLRIVYDALRCRDKTVRRIIPIIGRSLSTELRYAQYYHRDAVLEIAKKAIAWDAANPRDYDQRWIALFGEVAQTSPGTDLGEVSRSQRRWPEILQHVHDSHLQSVEAFVAEKKDR